MSEAAAKIDPEFEGWTPGHRNFTYVPSKTCGLFHAVPVGTYDYKCIRGVPASGKSIGCVWDMRYKAEMQPPLFDPKTGRMTRWTRWGVFRKTFQALKRTTIKDWLDWFPADGLTTLHESPPISGVFESPSIRNDGTWVRMELVYYATEARNFMSDLDSLSLSGAYFNEAADIEWDAIHKVQERVGRFMPPGAAAQGGFKGLSFGCIMDTNTPTDSSWWYQLEQVEKPDGMLFFIQPPAMIRVTKPPDPRTGCTFRKVGDLYYVRNDEAGCRTYGTSGVCENVEHLQEGWRQYEKNLVGADEEYVKTRILNEYGKLRSGQPVWPAFSDERHTTDEKLVHERGTPTLIGMDFGGNPAAVICQRTRMGQFRVLGEEVAFNKMVPPFVENDLIPRLIRDFNWPMTPAIVFGDPAGRNLTEMSVVSAYQFLESKGFRVQDPGLKNNDVMVRITAVDALLRNCDFKTNTPMFLMSRSCEWLREAMNGGYCYEKKRTAAGMLERYKDKPDKDSPYSHVADALQYVVVGSTGGGSSAYNASVGFAQGERFDFARPSSYFDFGCE